MKRIVFLTAFFVFSFYSDTFALWDIAFYGMPEGSEWTMQIVSLPFEGYNGVDDPELHLTRKDIIFNGTQHRRIVDNGVFGIATIDSQIVFHHNRTQIASCFYELGANGQRPVWGFGKYLITINVNSQPPQNFIFYWNSLDSKMGTNNYHERDYHTDWYINYSSLLHAILITGGVVNDTVFAFDPQNPYIKEIKLWKLLYPTKPNIEEPWERKFYARTTPFGVSPVVLEKYNLKHFILGTTVILDGVYPNNGNLDKYGYNTFLGPYPRNYWQDPLIEPGQNLTGYTYCTPGGWYNDVFDKFYGFKLTAGQNDTLILNSNMRLWISGFFDYAYTNQYFGDSIIFSLGSTLKKESIAQINTYLGGCLIDSGANAIWAGGSFHRAYAHSSLEYYGNLEHTVNNGGHIEIMGNATLKLGDNTTLTFDGTNSYLKLNQYAHVRLGINSQIKFINGAFLDANEADFTCDNGYWKGILFDNAGENTNIRYCTFNKANTALYIKNTTGGFNYPLYHNIFNVTTTGGLNKGIAVSNASNLTIDNNTFNQSSGTYGSLIQNTIYCSDLSFTNNHFTGGDVSLFIGYFASGFMPIFMFNNTFTGSSHCFVGRMISGGLHYNNMATNTSYYTMSLYQSIPNLANNTISNGNGNAIYLSSSYPNLSPVLNDENDFLWFGGFNHLTATNGDVIHFNLSIPELQIGYNCLTISNPNYYHLYGSVDPSLSQYFAKRNGWNGNGSIPRYYLYNTNNDPVTVLYQPVVFCNEPINFNSFILYELGDGTYDTVWVSDNNIGVQVPDDEVIYSQAMEHMGNNEYFNAITNLKNIIDNYPESSYLCASLYDLYACYEGLDTADQNHRDIIFGDLKFYLSNKIEQYEDNEEFVSIAYNLILMCETLLENYNDAMTGYEFIALYHPNPDERMWASMDYGYVYELLNGLGGGESSNPKRTSVNVLKLMDKKPYTKIVKDIYVRSNKKLEKKLNNKEFKNDKQMIQKKEMIDRAKQNVKVYRGLTKEQREQRRMEDIKILIGDDGSSNSDNITVVPADYCLHQNYPNPFNPITTIKYELPKDVFVTFTIYDILGREIYSVNEFKKAGVYEIKFDGSKYASGIYFYRLEAGSFIGTKKMGLIK